MRKLSVAYRTSRITAPNTMTGEAIIHFANGHQQVVGPQSALYGRCTPAVHHFLMGYDEGNPEFVSSAELASRMGITDHAAQSIKTIGRILGVPDLSRAEDTATAFAITTTTGPVIADRAWLERNKPAAGELLASTYDGPRYFAPDGALRPAPDACGDTLEGLVRDMVEHGGDAGAGWAARLRKLVDVELARREVFELKLVDELSPLDLAVFRKHWQEMRTGVAGQWAMPMMVAAPAPAPLPVVVMGKKAVPIDRTEEMLADLFSRGDGALPAKVTREALQDLIVSTTFEVRPDGRTTLCEITTVNGTTERGESTPALSVEFVKETGEKFALQQALDKLWPKEGYLLRELHFRAKRSAAV